MISMTETLTSAVVIFAPPSVQMVAIPLLQRYGPNALVRVPAHITILVPFVPVERLDQACEVLKEIGREIEPFEVTMSGYGSFPRIAFMTPLNPKPIQAVFQRIYEAFPECPPYGGAFGDDMHPHMTVGEFSSEETQKEVILPDYEPITFRVERLHVLQGIAQAALPWITHSVIPLGGTSQ